MLINENLSTENDEGKLSTVVKVKNKINCKNEKYQAQGVETMGDILKSYKKPDNIDDLDIHLLRGIYELQPEENIEHLDEDERGGRVQALLGRGIGKMFDSRVKTPKIETFDSLASEIFTNQQILTSQMGDNEKKRL